jgi:hypothetical protein
MSRLRPIRWTWRTHGRGECRGVCKISEVRIIQRVMVKENGREVILQRVSVFILCVLVMGAGFPLSGRAFETVYGDEDKEADIYGFVRNNLGMFVQTQESGGSGDQFATARTWLRMYGDFKLSSRFRVWMATQLIWEPWYKVEEGNPVSENGGPQQHRRPGWKTYSEFDDINDVLREAYVEWKINKRNTIKFGRQIAIWGEALTDRVGDVIHPNDSRFAFAFSNLEDTRIPQYMVRGYHEIRGLSSSIDWIVNPPVVAGQYTVNRIPSGGSANPFSSFVPAQRFAGAQEQRHYRLDPALPHAPAFVPAGPVSEVYPDQFSDTRCGFRTSTLLSGWQFGVSYFHTQNYSPLPSRNVAAGQLTLIHPQVDIIGATVNKQLHLGVMRAEVIYVPNMPFASFNIGPGEDGVVKRDRVKYMLAYDLQGFFNFQWHKTAPFNVTLEHVGEWVPDSRDLQYLPYYTKYPNYSPAFTVNINTTWFYNRLSTDLIMSYNAFGNAGLFMPLVRWMPTWQNQRFSAELKYIGIYGDSNYEGLGSLRKKDMLLLTTQFNF